MDDLPAPSLEVADPAPDPRQEVGVAVANPVVENSVASLGTVVYADHIRLDKRPGQGEDADPVVSLRSDQVVLGVFDGLGGAGAEAYETAEGRKSGAAIGASVAARVSREVLEQSYTRVAADDLKSALSRSLQQSLQSVDGEGSALKGRLIRKLPTTVALVRVEIGNAQVAPPIRVCTTFWAGDSRVYVLDHRGLRQLTRDHLATPQDAMQNLLQDAELSNCARADGDFYLESVDVEVGPSAFLMVAASDGVFGYLPTPMHFEDLLLQTIAASESFAHWKAALQQRIASYTQDDATLAYAAIGWPDFAAMKAALVPRTQNAAALTAEIDRAARTLHDATVAAAAANARFEEIRQSTWDAYRPTYELPANQGRS